MEEREFLHSGELFWKKGQSRVISSRGASGGIGMMWDKTKLELMEERQDTHWIYTQLRHKDSINIVSLFNIYVLFNYREKINVWTP